ncbi:DUF2336 domain-containing protein [Sphingomonas sp.]|uniref:DUF2336 domain-containing protein n=1 Tax=Sphingomonas sp. TaxID=28214 RepID=UPI002C31FB8A|nr:DUF2336 domain-containing protein [Sphingomonas sp.]HWK36915.1 DUF2336 domain-containing protein [Sphingomonas sp.]
MSETSVSGPGQLGPGARALLARAAGADARARVALYAAIDDVFLPSDARLDERTRAALTGLIESLVAAIEGDVREHAAGLLVGRGESETAEALGGAGRRVADRLSDAGLLRDPELIGECLARVRCELIAAALPAEAPTHPESVSLLVRLSGSPDRVVAASASAVLSGESHRRAIGEGGIASGSGLPAAVHQRLAWQVAAALRERTATGSPAALDRALIEATLRNIAANDGHDRLELSAMRLARAIDAQADELPALIEESLRDRRVTLLVAFLAHALGIDYDDSRAMVLDPAGERLWLVLHALEMSRTMIARIGYRLCEADGRRDVDAFADALDIVASIDPATARQAIAQIRLHPQYRAALRALDRGGGRR